MGTFLGHTIPGSFFIIIAIWWTVQAFNRYITCRRHRVQFKSTATFPCTCLCGRLRRARGWPLEGCIKIVFALIVMTIEIIWGFRSGEHHRAGNDQHATMSSFFGISGFVDILMFFRKEIPPNTDYVTVTLALIVEGVLFKFHLHGRTQLDTLIHTFLTYIIFLGAASILVEMRYKRSVLSPLLRAYCLLMQGTWFWQIAFILYNPLPGAMEWKADDHEQLMRATLFFTWHCGANFLLILIIGGGLFFISNKRYCVTTEKENLIIKNPSDIIVNTKGETRELLDAADSEDEEANHF